VYFCGYVLSIRLVSIIKELLGYNNKSEFIVVKFRDVILVVFRGGEQHFLKFAPPLPQKTKRYFISPPTVNPYRAY